MPAFPNGSYALTVPAWVEPHVTEILTSACRRLGWLLAVFGRTDVEDVRHGRFVASAAGREAREAGWNAGLR